MNSRRGFMAGLLAATYVPTVGWSAVGNPSYLAAAKKRNNRHYAIGLNSDGIETFLVPLPARGHAGAAHPFRAEAIAFARRPGRFAFVIDCATGTVLHQLAPVQEREFNGHGVYSADGQLLFTAEQIAQGSAGRIGVWDAQTYQRLGEFKSNGIGPHEVSLSRDGTHLIVANGGIETEAGGREKLNLNTMQPNLTYIDTAGRTLETVQLDPSYHKNSIRHLSVGTDGQVAFAMQWQGDLADAPPLIALHRRGEGPTICRAPDTLERAMGGYAGSVSFNGAGDEVAISSPKAGRILFFDTNGTFKRTISRPDVCGLAPHPDGFLASDGFGTLLKIHATGVSLLGRSEAAWDNHLITL